VGGDVVGINSAIFGPTYQGISFAIPSNLAREAYEQIRKDGKVIRGYLGVQLRPMTAAARMELPADFTGGAAVQIVHSDSPAEKAGIKKGDVIVKWNGQPVSSDGELRLMIARTPINGAAVPVTLYRNGKEQTIEVQVGVRPEPTK
jgi:serine protease Do